MADSPLPLLEPLELLDPPSVPPPSPSPSGWYPSSSVPGLVGEISSPSAPPCRSSSKPRAVYV